MASGSEISSTCEQEGQRGVNRIKCRVNLRSFSLSHTQNNQTHRHIRTNIRTPMHAHTYAARTHAARTHARTRTHIQKICIHTYVHTHTHTHTTLIRVYCACQTMYLPSYGVATISRLLQIISLFCRISSVL